MNYNSVHDISHRLVKQLNLGVRSSNEIVLKVLRDLLCSCEGKIVDSKRILGSVTKLTHVKDFRVKKLVYLYLSFAADEDSEVWFHVMNSVSNDLIDPNPSIRRSPLVFLGDSHSLSTALNDVRVEHIVKCLKDLNPGVRKCAVAGIAKMVTLFETCKVDFDMSSILDSITQMIYLDDDPTVIVECIHCLKICNKSALKVETLLSLLERMEMVEVWTKAEIVNLFMKVVDMYKVTHDQIFKALNLMDPYLDYKFPVYLGLSCTTAMLLISKRFSNIHCDVKKRVLDFLLSKPALIPKHIKPLYISVLNVVLDKTAIDKLTKCYKQFLPLPSDCQFMKILKLKILAKVCTKDNAFHIFRTATTIAMTSLEKELSLFSMETLLFVCTHLPKECINFLLSVLKHDHSAVVDSAVSVLWKMAFSKEEVANFDGDALADALVTIYNKLSSYDTKAAFFSFMCLFAKKRHAKPLSNILELEAASWSSTRSPMFKIALLRTSASLYFLSPEHFQPILGKILLLGAQEDNLLINRQAFMYYDLLQNDVEAAKKYFLKLARRKHLINAEVLPQVERLSSLCLLSLEPG